MTGQPLIFTGCNAPVSPAAAAGQVRILAWVCWMCGGRGRWESGERCMQCTGCGLTDDLCGATENVDGTPLRRAPRPPAVMARPCADCAFRPCSPEAENGTLDAVTASGQPFWCHHGLHDTGEAYTPAAVIGELPLGAMLCAGWWAHAAGEPLPAAAYRDPPPRGLTRLPSWSWTGHS